MVKTALETLLEAKRATIGSRRIAKIRTNTRTLEKLAGKPIDEVIKSLPATKQLAEKIANSGYSPATKSDFRLMLKMIWKVGNGYEVEDRPREVRFLKVGVSRKDRKHPRKVSEEEYRAMLAAADGRDKAILSVLYEGGLRPHELLSLKKKDVEFEKEGARVFVPEGSKTGAREILLIDSEPLLASWLANHPLKGDTSLLFPSLSGTSAFRSMSVEGLNKRVKEIAEKAKITRKIKSYDFRHTSASRLAKILTDAQMKAYFGWTQDSKMSAVYVDMSGRDVDSSLLAAHGRKVDKQELEGKLEPKFCSRCRRKNAHDAEQCDRCGLSFDATKAKLDTISMHEELMALREEIQRMKANANYGASVVRKLKKQPYKAPKTPEEIAQYEGLQAEIQKRLRPAKS